MHNQRAQHVNDDISYVSPVGQREQSFKEAKKKRRTHGGGEVTWLINRIRQQISILSIGYTCTMLYTYIHMRKEVGKAKKGDDNIYPFSRV